jgi:hypothetical protein
MTKTITESAQLTPIGATAGQLALTDGQWLTPQSTNLNAEKMRLAKSAAKTMLASYPDYRPDASPPEYLNAITAALAEYGTSTIAMIVREVPKRCKFLPTIAEITETVRWHETRFGCAPRPRQVAPPEPEISAEERTLVAQRMKAYVQELRQRDRHRQSDDFQRRNGPNAPWRKGGPSDELREHCIASMGSDPFPARMAQTP